MEKGVGQAVSSGTPGVPSGSGSGSGSRPGRPPVRHARHASAVKVAFRPVERMRTGDPSAAFIECGHSEFRVSLDIASIPIGIIAGEQEPFKEQRGGPAVPETLWEIALGQEPVVATALHDGHELREEVSAIMALSDADRLREEDPYTGGWTEVASTRLIPRRSRFEVDLNRPRERAVYRTPDDCWGLEVWKKPPPDDLVERSLADYDAFYARTHRILSEMERRHGHFVVLDLHSYNHRRGGPDASPDDPEANPEVNIGTGSLDRARWGHLVDRFIHDLTGFAWLGRNLDVRENVRFRGGHFSRWIHENFPHSACCLAVEFKKLFMDEWTGQLKPEEFEASRQALHSTLPGLSKGLAETPPAASG